MNEKVIDRWAPVAICAVGLILAHHEMFKTGFAVTQNDLGDTRFVHYLLEHALQHVLGNPANADYWSPPFFAPTTDHLAWSENMAGAAWVYFPIRLFFEPHTAFQLWGLGSGILNFFAAYLLLKGAFRFSTVGSSIGAALFAFSAVRINQTMHWQLFPHFYTPIAAYAAYRLAHASQLTERGRVFHLALLAAMAVGQLWASIYLGWFLVFVFALGLGLGLCWKQPRQELWALLKGHPWTIALVSLLSLAALYPMGWRYLAVAREFGGRPYEEALTMLPLPTTWLHLGRDSWLWGFLWPANRVQPMPLPEPEGTTWWLIIAAATGFGSWRASTQTQADDSTGKAARALMWLSIAAFAYIGYQWVGTWSSLPIPMEHEQRCGFGYIAAAIATFAFIRGRKEPKVLYVGLLLALLIAVTSLYSRDGTSPWRYVHAYFPAAQAIRAVARASIVYMLGISVGVAAALTALAKNEQVKWAVLPLGALLVFEQGYNTPAFSKEANRRDIAAVAAAIEPGCEVMLMSPVQGYGPYWKYQLDAMWGSLVSGIPTMNGYSGQSPKDWPLGDTNLRDPRDEQRVAQAGGFWFQSQPRLKGKRPCWARVGFNEGPNFGSELVSVEAPATLRAGEQGQAEVVFKNLGPKPWPMGAGIRLGAQSPQDNTQWGGARVELPHAVEPGQTVAFRFPITAPQQAGKYAFQWRMVADGVQWIGALSQLRVIDVVASEVPPLLAAPPDAGL